MIDDKTIRQLNTAWGQAFTLPDAIAALDARTAELAALSTDVPDYAVKLADHNADLAKTLTSTAKDYAKYEVLAANVHRARNLVAEKRKSILNNKTTLDELLDQMDLDALEAQLNTAPDVADVAGNPGKAIELGKADEFQKHSVATQRLRTLIALKDGHGAAWVTDIPELPALNTTIDHGPRRALYSNEDRQQHQQVHDLINRYKKIDQIEEDLIAGTLVVDLPRSAEELYDRIERAHKVGKTTDVSTRPTTVETSPWRKSLPYA